MSEPTLTRASFEREMRRARAMADTDPERVDYWHGYQRGLRRAYHGHAFGTAEEHQLWTAMADSEDGQRRQRGLGYQDGLGYSSARPGRSG